MCECYPSDFLVSSLSDVVISFVKKTVAGVAGLLRLRNPLMSDWEKSNQYEDSQVCAASPNTRCAFQHLIQGVSLTALLIFHVFCLCSQHVTLMGIDELHTSWLDRPEWRISKS